MIRQILSGLFFTLLASAATADTLTVPKSGGFELMLPARGLTMAVVEEQFGSPTRVIDAVGDPPITRWVYPDYTVYFEDEYVIQPVIRSSYTGHNVTQ